MSLKAEAQAPVDLVDMRLESSESVVIKVVACSSQLHF